MLHCVRIGASIGAHAAGAKYLSVLQMRHSSQPARVRTARNVSAGARTRCESACVSAMGGRGGVKGRVRASVGGA